MQYLYVCVDQSRVNVNVVWGGVEESVIHDSRNQEMALENISCFSAF
jgi:hypothetical protein